MKTFSSTHHMLYSNPMQTAGHVWQIIPITIEPSSTSTRRGYVMIVTAFLHKQEIMNARKKVAGKGWKKKQEKYSSSVKKLNWKTKMKLTRDERKHLLMRTTLKMNQFLYSSVSGDQFWFEHLNAQFVLKDLSKMKRKRNG